MESLRPLALFAVALMLPACAWRGEGPDPTRYPWDQAKPKASYCIVSLDLPGSGGIGGGNSAEVDCKVGPNARPRQE